MAGKCANVIVKWALGALWLSACPSVGVQGAPPAAVTPVQGEVETMAVEALVREVYSRHERQVTASGTPLTVEISDVRVIPASDFGAVRMRDVLTLAPSQSIGITVSTRSLKGVPIGISFPARWMTNSTPGGSIEEALDMSVEGAFELAREAGEGFQVPEAIVAFDSRVTLEGRSVAYRAYFLVPQYRPGEPIAEFQYNDPVLRLEPELLAEERTARTEAELRELVMNAQPGPP